MTNQRISRGGQFHVDDIPVLLSNIFEASTWTTLVDFGCGDGSLLHAMNLRKELSNKSIYGLDVSQDRMKIVQKISSELGCVVASACDMPLADKSIDLFVSTQVIEHVPDDVAMAEEMHRVLTDDGTVYLSTVFKKPYGWYFYRNNGRWVLDPTHVREYTDHNLLETLKNAGFEIVETRKTLDNRPLMDAIVRRLRFGRNLYRNRVFKLLRNIKIPIPGYYNWEIVCVKQSKAVASEFVYNGSKRTVRDQPCTATPRPPSDNGYLSQPPNLNPRLPDCAAGPHITRGCSQSD